MDIARKIVYSLISAFRWALPVSVRNSIKNYAELKFQKGYVETFSRNKPLFEEHFRRYRFYDEMEGTLNIGPDTKVLDVGCGISTVLHFMPGRRYGLDPLGDEYRKIYSYPQGIEVRTGHSEDMPFENEFFDVVFCTNVLDHVENPIRTISEIRRVLKPGGHFVLTTEVFPKMVTRDPGHPHVFMEGEVPALVADKFEVVMERSSPMMELKEDGDKLSLVESSNDTTEIVLLLKKS